MSLVGIRVSWREHPSSTARLGPHRILSLIGRGGMGEVYRARDTRLDRIDALKILPVEVAADPERIRRFIREAKAASALNHPNIATIYEIGESGGIHWISMELVEGETLAEGLKEKSLDIPEILDIGIQVCEALEKAHGKGIVHRDIKPANIMLTPEGQVKVLDFGLAKITRPEGKAATATVSTESHTIPGMVMGTARYMSPEQVLGQAVDHRTDIFSLGAVLYEMATGQPPFRGETSSAIFDAIVHQMPAWSPRAQTKIPEEMRRIIQKSLEKFREMRYQSASDLCADLRRLKRPDVAGSAAVAPSSVVNRKWIAAGFIGTSLSAAGVLWYASRHPALPPVEVLNAVPLTTYPGIENEPSFSPDGSQVAFTWKRRIENNSSIYVKVIGAENPLRLTNDETEDFSPVWSPDGRWIAFCRELPGNRMAVLLIPPLGGREQVLTETLFSGQTAVRHSYLAWSPDCRSLVISGKEAPEQPTSLYVFSLESREKWRLTTSALPSDLGDTMPALSPDGRILAFCRFTGWQNSDLYLVELLQDLKAVSEPKRLTLENYGNVWPAWTRDGRELVFSAGGSGTGFNMWRMDPANPGAPRLLATAGKLNGFPVIARQGNRMAYVQWASNFGIWKMEVSASHAISKGAAKLTSTTSTDVSPRFSPDGKRIAFFSERSGSNQIWICDPDGTNPAQLTSLGEGNLNWSFPWSPDSSRLAFDWARDGIRDVYVVSVAGGPAQRLTTSPRRKPAGSNNPSWSRDGRWILFDREEAIWRIPADGGDPVRLFSADGFAPVESSDGRFICYCGGEIYHRRLWKVPKDGGGPQKAIESLYDNESYHLIENGISFIPEPDATYHYSIRYLNTITGSIRNIASFDHWINMLTVSPDGRSIVWSQGEFDSDLMLVENFH